jgi:hypothetical protein
MSRYPTGARASIRIPKVTVVEFTRVGMPTVESTDMLSVAEKLVPVPTVATTLLDWRFEPRMVTRYVRPAPRPDGVILAITGAGLMVNASTKVADPPSGFVTVIDRAPVVALVAIVIPTRSLLSSSDDTTESIVT